MLTSFQLNLEPTQTKITNNLSSNFAMIPWFYTKVIEHS